MAQRASRARADSSSATTPRAYTPARERRAGVHGGAHDRGGEALGGRPGVVHAVATLAVSVLLERELAVARDEHAVDLGRVHGVDRLIDQETIMQSREQSIAAAPVIANLVVEAERKAEIARREAEIQYEKWRREELLKIIETWSGVRRIESFFEDAERRVAALPDDQAAPLRERLARARELIGEADALRGLREWRAPEEQPGS